MITEKDIEKSKFFTITGSDIWKITAVDIVTEVELLNCENGITGILRLGGSQTGRLFEEGAERKFVPITMPRISTPPKTARTAGGKRKKPAGKVTSRKTKTSTEREQGCGIRKGKKPSSKYLASKYLGVRAVKGKHYVKYHAQVNRGKFVHLGTFNIEEEAAAAVQEHLGNSEEATRLRTMARGKIQEKIEETKGQTAWMCTKCGAGYSKKPEKCTKCGSSSFTKARVESDTK